MMESGPAPLNPYVAPPSERHSANLSRFERNLLKEVLEIRESNAGNAVLSRSMTRSLLCSPIAVIFAGSFAGCVYFLFDMPAVYTTAVAVVAFLSTMAGFFLRDLSEAKNTRTLWDLLCSITDFAEAERLLYGSQKSTAVRPHHDEPLAAIPVEDE